MKEVKFRAWEKNRNIMIPYDEIEFQWDASNQELELCGKVSDNPLPYNHGIFMQYIGVKDKNKKEIYVGDIATYINSNGTHIGVVKWINTLNAFRLVFTDREDFFFITSENEVIGNIHENQELLEKK